MPMSDSDGRITALSATTGNYWGEIIEKFKVPQEKLKTEKQWWALMKRDMTEYPISKRIPDPIMEELLLDPRTGKLAEYRGLDYINGGSSIDTIVTEFPPHVQTTLKLFLEVFAIDPYIIPSPHSDKDGFAMWIKEIGKIREIGGTVLRDSLIRAKRNYDERHEQSFELDHPATIYKILRTAKLELEEELENLVEMKPEEKKELAGNEGLSSLRGLFE